MPVKIIVPGSLRHWFDGETEYSCKGKRILDCIHHLDERFPDVKAHIVDSQGNISNVLIFLNGDNLRTLDGLSTTVKDGDEISIIPLAAGG
ncbi:MAG: MoaD family protein [Deltaproteobacteria bacterium]|nr:MoaD family protein [Deltaproteobacteria bacterium]